MNQQVYILVGGVQVKRNGVTMIVDAPAPGEAFRVIQHDGSFAYGGRWVIRMGSTQKEYVNGEERQATQLKFVPEPI